MMTESIILYYTTSSGLRIMFKNVESRENKPDEFMSGILL